MNHRSATSLLFTTGLLAAMAAPLAAQFTPLGGGSGTSNDLAITVVPGTIGVQLASPLPWAPHAVAPGLTCDICGGNNNLQGAFSWVIVSNPTPPVPLPSGCAVLHFNSVATMVNRGVIGGLLAAGGAQIPYPAGAAGFTVNVQTVSMPINQFTSGTQWIHGTVIYSCGWSLGTPVANETCDLFGLGHFHFSNAYTVVLP